MDYFALFEIPVQLKVDLSALPRKYFELSKKFHPDYYINQSPAIQAEVLEKSALLNKAFRTFQKQDDTIKYVLQQKGLLEEEEKYELPPGFLMEVLEINEQLMDLTELHINRLSSRITELEREIYETIKKIVEYYQEGVTTTAELLQVKEYYYKKKYLDRIRQQLAGMA